MIKNYNDFIETLITAGFSMGGGNSEDIYSIVSWNWNEEPPYDSPVRWHTEDPETDPWEWRIRILTERDDIAYAKLFFKKSGYITKDWYPYFLAARRKGKDFNEAYMDGEISSYAKRIYEVVAAHSRIPSHVIKQEAGFSSEEKAAFDKGLTELQMKLFITVCGNERTANWPSAVFCTTERFWGEALFVEADKIKPDIALKKITEQVLYLNPSAPAKKIIKFINGK